MLNTGLLINGAIEVMCEPESTNAENKIFAAFEFSMQNGKRIDNPKHIVHKENDIFLIKLTINYRTMRNFIKQELIKHRKK